MARLIHNDGDMFLIFTTGDIKDIRDANELLTIKYKTPVKYTGIAWLIRVVKRFFYKGTAVEPRSISIGNEKSFERFLMLAEQNKGGNKQ